MFDIRVTQVATYWKSKSFSALVRVKVESGDSPHLAVVIARKRAPASSIRPRAPASVPLQETSGDTDGRDGCEAVARD
jgi:hypothetical protein